MSAFEDHKERSSITSRCWEAPRRLAVTLDRVTNAMVLVGQHGVYCHSHRDPAKPTMDIQIITEELRKAKELIQSVNGRFAGGTRKTVCGQISARKRFPRSYGATEHA